MNGLLFPVKFNGKEDLGGSGKCPDGENNTGTVAE
jgi:hypothetical protein